MRQLNDREKMVLALTVAVLAVWAGSSLIVGPWQANAEGIDRKLELTARRLSQAQRQIDNAPQVKERWARLEEMFGVADKDGAEMSAVVARIESAAAQTSIHVVNLQPRRVVSRDEGRFYPVEMQVNGPWPSMVRFLSLVQAAPHHFFIEEMSLENYGYGNSFLNGRFVLSRFRLSKN